MQIKVNLEHPADPIIVPVIRSVLRSLLHTVAGEYPELNDRGQLSVDITLVDGETIRELNGRFRGKDELTDVLAFPLLDAHQSDDPFSPPSAQEPRELGDVVISVPVADEGAKARGVSLVHELAFLACHGTLHLLGWDHPDDSSLESMHQISLDALATVLPEDPVLEL